jgi:DNA-binding GntR family transcriptional regulator
MNEQPSRLAAGTDPSDRVLQIAGRIEDAIQAGDLAPGARIAEAALAASLDVGRAPLREALRLLEGRRLLTRTPNAGVRIVDVRGEDLVQLLGLREVLEGLASREAAANITLAEIHRLEDCLEAQARLDSEGLGAVFRNGSTDNDFHLGILAASRNQWLIQSLGRDLYSLLRLYRFRSASLGDRARQATVEHRRILDAIARRDPDAAEAEMRAHIRNGSTRLSRL